MWAERSTENDRGLFSDSAEASTTPSRKALAVAPFADIIWMETKTANLPEAAEFAQAIHAVYPNKMLAYNLSPSF